MQKLDSVPFLILLLEAAQRFKVLPKDGQTLLAAARIACSVGLAPKSGIAVNDDLVGAIVFYGSAKRYEDVPLNVINLMARLHEERAFASYQRHYARHAA